MHHQWRFKLYIYSWYYMCYVVGVGKIIFAARTIINKCKLIIQYHFVDIVVCIDYIAFELFGCFMAATFFALFYRAIHECSERAAQSNAWFYSTKTTANIWIHCDMFRSIFKNKIDSCVLFFWKFDVVECDASIIVSNSIGDIDRVEKSAWQFATE